MKDLFGNTLGLAPGERRKLEHLYERRVRPWQLVSPELARTMCELSAAIGRQIGVVLDRRGYVEWVVLGNDRRLYLPDLGRIRAGRARFRGLRLVHTHLHDEALTRDDLADLDLLRLDYVAAVTARPDGLPGRVRGAYLLPGTGIEGSHRLEEFSEPHAIEIDFLAFITELEAEFAQKVELPEAVGVERAVLVAVAEQKAVGEDLMAELLELARTADVAVLGTILQIRKRPDTKYVVGRGKLEEIVVLTMQKGAELIIFGNNLTPAQGRAIADFTELNVIDRTQLILDIFAKRALSRDGKLQVELAQLKYRLPRLTAMDSGLSRLVGRIGGRGPGETKLEIDRRRARERITRLEALIRDLSAQRAVRREKRSRAGLPVVALVGYTNAGKSTLLNKLTHSHVFVEDKLFATLDPTSRRLRFPADRNVILIDTVGFIHDMPPDLLKAFRATFEELGHADLLLHVADLADQCLGDKIESVRKILRGLDLGQTPEILLLNKADRLPREQVALMARRYEGIPIAAIAGRGFSELLEAAEHSLWREGAAERGVIFPTGAPPG